MTKKAITARMLRRLEPAANATNPKTSGPQTANRTQRKE